MIRITILLLLLLDFIISLLERLLMLLNQSDLQHISASLTEEITRRKIISRNCFRETHAEKYTSNLSYFVSGIQWHNNSNIEVISQVLVFHNRRFLYYDSKKTGTHITHNCGWNYFGIRISDTGFRSHFTLIYNALVCSTRYLTYTIKKSQK